MDNGGENKERGGCWGQTEDFVLDDLPLKHGLIDRHGAAFEAVMVMTYDAVTPGRGRADLAPA